VHLEQVTRYAVRGSRLRGTREVECLGVETRVHVVSSEPPERIRRLLQEGERTCFTMQALLRPVPVKTCATLNGEELTLEVTDRR
jgi:hypothetical protein